MGGESCLIPLDINDESMDAGLDARNSLTTSGLSASVRAFIRMDFGRLTGTRHITGSHVAQSPMSIHNLLQHTYPEPLRMRTWQRSAVPSIGARACCTFIIHGACLGGVVALFRILVRM